MPIFLPINTACAASGTKDATGTFHVMKQFFGSIRGRTPALLLAILLMFAANLSVTAQTAPAPEQQGPPIIKSVEVQYVGPQTISRDESWRRCGPSRASPIPNRWSSRTSRRFTRRARSRTSASLAQPDGDGVKVMVVLQTRSLVNEIEIDGRRADERQKIAQSKSKLKINGPLSEDELEKAREKIIESYQAKGFTDVDVKFKVEHRRRTRGTSRVVYTINEGTKGAIGAVRFEGNTKFSDRDPAQADEDQGQDALSHSSISPAGSMKPSWNRISARCRNGIRTTATSTSKSKKFGANVRSGKLAMSWCWWKARNITSARSRLRARKSPAKNGFAPS